MAGEAKNYLFKFTVIDFVFTTAIIFIIYFFSKGNQIISLITGIIFLLYLCYIYGSMAFSQNSFLYKIIVGFIIILSIITITGTAAYYLYAITDITLIFQLCFLIFIPFIFLLKNNIEYNFAAFIKNLKIKIQLASFLSLGYFTAFTYLIYLLNVNQTVGSIRTPWEVVPNIFFLVYFLATFILVLKLYLQPKNSLIFLILHFFLTFSVAFLIYKIGYSYDAFIHRRNELTILNTGTLLPKSFYYIGQYSQIIFFQKFLYLPLFFTDKIWLPFLSAITLPTIIILAFRENYKIKNNYLKLLPLTFLLLPFGNYIVTAPQGLANLYSILIIILMLFYLHHQNKCIWLMLLFALTAITIHPLTGVPLLFFVILNIYYAKKQQKNILPSIIQKSIFWEIVIIFFLAIPTAFLINSLTTSEMKININLNFISEFINSIKNFDFSFYYRPFINIFDLIYTFARNINYLIIILTIYGIIFILNRKKIKFYLIYIISFIILLLNYLFLKNFFIFNSLISYERQNYTQRVWELAWFFLLPFFLIAGYQIIIKIIKNNGFLRLLIFIFISFFITISLYLSYPRVDLIAEDHGYSTSQVDIKTVLFLEKINKNTDYLVLAGQPVSAAAIQELGFKKYYQGYFFYPVPTGNKLYEYFLDLAYDKRDAWVVINDVNNLTKVNNIYLVINDYWWAAEDVIAKQKNQATDWFSIDGKNFIFKYVLKK